MTLAKFVWTALTWALGLGPLSLMAYGLPLHAGKRLMGTNAGAESADAARPAGHRTAG
jgi:hypothetical protein